MHLDEALVAPEDAATPQQPGARDGRGQNERPPAPGSAMQETIAQPVLDVEYTWQAYDFLSPLVLDLAAAMSGFKRRRHDEPFTYCDLGCGNAVTLNVLAGCFPNGAFYGADLNPRHIENGERTAEIAGIDNLHLFAKSFEEMLDADIPQMDYIVVHGVMSWVDDVTRRQVTAFAERFLKPDGLLFASYNAAPGWSRHIPIREFLKTLAARQNGDSRTRMARARNMLRMLSSKELPYFKSVPDAQSFVELLCDRDLTYMAHEFLNDAWRPLTFSEVCDVFSGADLAFCGTTDHERRINGEALRKQLRFGEPEPRGQEPADVENDEALISLLLNERFRRDVFCRRSYLSERAETPQFDDWVFGGDLPLLANGPNAEALKKGDAGRLAKALAQGDRTAAAVQADPALATTPAQFESHLKSLLAAGLAQPFAKPAIATEVSKEPDARYRLISPLNRFILTERLLKEKRISIVAPVLGASFNLSATIALLLLAADQAPLGEMGAWAEAELEKRGAQITPNDHTPVETSPLKAEAGRFIEQRLEMFVRLGVLERA